MKKRAALGKGLDALFSQNDYTANSDDKPDQTVSLHLIDPNPNQPRRTFDAEKLQELADSIALHGVLQPILLVAKNDRFMIVAGERRWRAARLAGLTEIPALIRQFDGQEIAAIALVENLQRDDLNPIEAALGVSELIRSYGLTQEQISSRIGKSRSSVANSLRLLHLPKEVQKMVSDGQLSAGHAKVLVGMEDEENILSLAKAAIEQGLSVRQIEEMARTRNTSTHEKRDKRPLCAELLDFKEDLTKRLGAKVTIQGNESKGKLTIEYDAEVLQQLFHLINE